MKSFFKVVTIAVALVSVPVVNASQEAAKIGVVFPTKILKASPQRDVIQKSLQAEFKDRYEDIQAIEAKLTELDAKLKRDREMMSASDAFDLNLQIEVKRSEYQLKRKAFEENNRRRQNEEQQKSFLEVQKVIDAVAAKQGYDVIMNGEQTLYTNPALDISDLIIKEISKK
ncbi:OmpH family outer membrane protein [Psychromonas aquimarina]|uniref:OmpH family outer membrane protein n=1 Tax=Psychromonas aquimarina TaxID=444919 RepID=UPI00041E633A|nr:OmpH family outer membrane protein [Psychromonas aquimarina]